MRNYGAKILRFFDEWEFKRQQADYFLYVSQLLQGTQGQYTVRSIFAADAQRYGDCHYRGRLAAHWLAQYQQNGGNLALTLRHVLSADAWLLIKISQDHGDQALLQALNTLAQQLEEQKQFKGLLVQLFWPVIFAVILLSAMLFLIPWFTVPQLQQTFYAVPDELYGPHTQRLFVWSTFTKRYGVWIIISLILLVVLIVLSLSRYCGRWRSYLDALEPWRSYKALQALRMLVLLSLLLQNASQQLRLAQALQLMQTSPNPWLRHHLQHIQKKIMQGETGAYSFDVGLLSKDLVWFLADMELSQGLAKALHLTTLRLHAVLAKRLPLQAQVWRWVVLLGCVAALLLIGGWHYVVIDELRQALLMMYAN